LATVPAQSVFVGDDPTADIEGAAAVGMKTIHVLSDSDTDERCVASRCRIHVRGLDRVPAIADELVPLKTECYVS
jgi:FMN phosphatase YigB (HAD superfamily)